MSKWTWRWASVDGTGQDLTRIEILNDDGEVALLLLRQSRGREGALADEVVAALNKALTPAHPYYRRA